MTTNSKLTNVDRVKWAIARMRGGCALTMLDIRMQDVNRRLDNQVNDPFMTDDQIKRAIRSIPGIKLGQKIKGRRTPK